MSRIDNRLIVELGAPREGPCVSFYFAAPPAGPEIQQGPVTLTNLVRDARRLLSEGGMREEEARRLLAPAERLVQDQAAWSQTGQGIAVFVAPGTMRTVRATPAFNTWLVIGRRFVTRPLLRAASDQVDFYVLALSQGSVRLLQVSGFDVEEINVPGMPAGIADILKYAELEAPPMEFHTAGRGRQRDAMAFHGTS
ncbi:MAG: hypothetical protein HY682_06220, partial [Chloroflexi bacterium]|nr:hypothetical protein [Chloroflexota bacterium]